MQLVVLVASALRALFVHFIHMITTPEQLLPTTLIPQAYVTWYKDAASFPVLEVAAKGRLGCLARAAAFSEEDRLWFGLFQQLLPAIGVRPRNLP